IGLPVRVVVGKNAAEGIVEVKRRDTGESEDVAVSELVDYVTALYAQVK
ncbi:His/Gly/Thr/Pro-type tRNA ligase C-terminal domain-containing protein, partial [Staphylococcus arlettae]